MNHFSLSLPPSDTLWYSPMDDPTHPHPHPTKPPSSFPLFFSLNPRFPQNDDLSDNSSANDNRSETESSQSHPDHHREPMFEKPLTPSDVGKLNRLVIPKQHAEKYFPLAGTSAAVSSSSEACATTPGGGGVLLGFEDETGKCWRFRYSYWNSSQSYVLTKGWSRFVKEKKLDAGDVVLFERHRFEPDRFFIGWRRRLSAAPPPVHIPARPIGLYNAVQVRHGYPVPQLHRIPAASLPYQAADCFHAGTDVRQQSQKPASSSGGNSKKLRLFGVNLECQNEDDEEAEPQTSDGSSLSSQGPVHGSGSGLGLGFGFGSSSGSGLDPTGYNYTNYMGYPPNHHHNHMDISFSQDVNQMRNRMG